MYNDFFANLYLGNYRPTENNDGNQEVIPLENKMDEIHKKLTHTLDSKNLELFLQFDEIRDDLVDFYETKAFAKGIEFMFNLVSNLPSDATNNPNVKRFIQDLYDNSKSENT